MYIHIGNDFVIRSRDLIGIFNIENTTVSADTRSFLKMSAERGCEVSCTDDLPRSFTVTFNTENLDEKVYIGRLSVSAIEKRTEGKGF